MSGMGRCSLRSTSQPGLGEHPWGQAYSPPAQRRAEGLCQFPEEGRGENQAGLEVPH